MKRFIIYTKLTYIILYDQYLLKNEFLVTTLKLKLL